MASVMLEMLRAVALNWLMAELMEVHLLFKACHSLLDCGIDELLYLLTLAGLQVSGETLLHQQAKTHQRESCKDLHSCTRGYLFLLSVKN